MLESQIEKKAVHLAATKHGVMSLKLTSMYSTGYPDRIFWIPGGRPLMIEFKAGKGKVTPKQQYIHERLREWGYQVEVCYDALDALEKVELAVEKARV